MPNVSLVPMKMLLAALALVITTMLLTTDLGAATRYGDQSPGVNCTGNYSKANRACNGADGNSYTSLQALVNAAVAGDTLLVRAGTYDIGGYSGSQLVITTTGTVGSPMTFKNYPGESPIITTTVLSSGSNSIFLGTAAIAATTVCYWTIEGFEVTGIWFALKGNNACNSTIRNNYFHDNKGGIVFTQGAFALTFDRNRVFHNGQFALCASTPTQCNQDHGFYIMGSNHIFTNNLIYDNLAYGIQADSAVFNATTMPNSSYSHVGGWKIENNTIAYQRYRAAIVLWSNSNTLDTTTIKNNILYENGQSAGSANTSNAIDYCGSPSTVTMTNNIDYATSPGPTAFSAQTCSGTEVCNSCTISNNPSSNPSFVNGPSTIPASPDFHLNSGSPAIGVGVDLTGVVTTDYDGLSRSAPYDDGAYKYVSAIVVDPTAPAAPVGLRVQ